MFKLWPQTGVNKLRRFYASALVILLALSIIAPPLALASKVNSAATTGPSAKNYKLGCSLFKKGDYDGAIDAELQSIYYSRNGYQPDAYYMLGISYQAKKDYTKAYEALQKSISQAMNSANETHLSLAQVCTKLKKFQEAQGEEFKAFYGMPRGDLWGRICYQKGINLEEWGKPEEALGAFAEAEGKAPWRYWDPWIHFVECLMKVKKWIEAYQSLQLMIGEDAFPGMKIKGLDFERVYLDMGICALAKGNHQGALDAWRKTLEYNGDNKEAHLQIGLLLDSEQHITSALSEYKDFIRLAGEDDAVRVKQVESRLAVLEQMQGKQDAPPPPTAPSPYMRAQQAKQQQQQQPIGEPGF